MAPAKGMPNSSSVLTTTNGMAPCPSHVSFVAMSDDACDKNLRNIGLKTTTSDAGVHLSVQALKRVEVDRLKLLASNKSKNSTGSPLEKVVTNPFESSDDEDADTNSDLLAHLIKDVSEVGLETEDLDMSICDLMASKRKSHKKKKVRNKTKHSSS